MKILITGAKGQVGTELVLEANNRGHEVFAFGSKELDISQLESLQKMISSLQPDVIINAAAYTAVDKAEIEPDLAYAVNALGSENLAIVAKQNNIPLLHISTDYVYDGNKATAYSETDQENPIGVYGTSKLAGDQKIIEIWHKHIILRVSWVFATSGNNFVKTMLRLAEQRDELNIVNDQFGAPTSARAISASLLDILQAPSFNRTSCPWGVYNLQSDPGVTWYEFAQEIFSQAQKIGLLDKTITLNPIPSSQFPTPVKRPKNSKLKGEKLQQLFSLAVVQWKKDLAVMLRELKAL